MKFMLDHMGISRSWRSSRIREIRFSAFLERSGSTSLTPVGWMAQQMEMITSDL